MKSAPKRGRFSSGAARVSVHHISVDKELWIKLMLGIAEKIFFPLHILL